MDFTERIKSIPLKETLNNLIKESKKQRKKLIIGSISAFTLYGISSFITTKIKKKDKPMELINTNEKKKKNYDINMLFFKRLFFLFKIIVPKFWSTETWLLFLHTLTTLSLYVASLDGKIVSKQGQKFIKLLCLWMLVGIPATYTNSMLSFLQNKLALQFRTTLTKRLNQMYLKEKNFYAVSNLDDRIKNIDQCLAVDVEKFCTSFINLYSNLAKPSIDLVLYNIKLGMNVGLEVLVCLNIFVDLSALILRKATPPFGRFVAKEQEYEGNFRYVHSRLLENSEEVRLLKGQDVEYGLVTESYMKLVSILNQHLRVKALFDVVEDLIAKYFWGFLGYLLCGVPAFLYSGEIEEGENVVAARTKEFVFNRRLLLHSSDAFTRILVSYKELVELAGYTGRVSELIEVLSDIENHEYKKLSGQNMITPITQGTIQNGEVIKFTNVAIVSPIGEVLIDSMSIDVLPGNNLLVIGPNGCGKSSMFRVLGGLWPVTSIFYANFLEGRVTKPMGKMFYIPQRPYFCSGTLRDQIIYPHTRDQMLESTDATFLLLGGVSDNDLIELLKIVHLRSIVKKDRGLDTEKEWKDALSGGDKQRFLGTSAVSMEIEKIMYTHATSNFYIKGLELGITLITVSHRASLWTYHNYILQFDGQGGYIFMELDAEKRLKLQEEKQKLEHNLLGVEKMKQRLEELKSAA